LRREKPGEPRDSTEPALRERKRPKGAFGSLPYQPLAGSCYDVNSRIENQAQGLSLMKYRKLGRTNFEVSDISY